MLKKLVARWIQWMNDKTQRLFLDVALLFLRLVSAGFMLWAHGWGKLSNFSEYATKFPDPLGVGATPSLILAVFAEFFCAILVIIGFATRLALTQLIATMIVAGFIVHGADPFQKKELALVYLTIFSTLFLMGPGKFSIDHMIVKKCSQ